MAIRLPLAVPLAFALGAPVAAQTVSAAASAVTQLRVRAGANMAGLPAGSDLTAGASLQQSDTAGVNSSADASFSAALTTNGTTVTFVLEESSEVSVFSSLSADTGPHQTELMLHSPTPIVGVLRVTLERLQVGIFAASDASIDVDDDGQYDWTAPSGGSTETWSTRLVIDGPTPIRALTATEAGGFVGDSPMRLTVEFVEAKRAVLPDDHHLSSSPLQWSPTAAPEWWTESNGRFQLLYEASHFLAAGVTGQVTLQRLMLRLRDGVPSLGGRSWSGVQVRVGSTARTAAQLSDDFAANLVGMQTALGAVGTVNVVEATSTGRWPNSDALVLDLAAIGASIAYDPTGSAPNLLVDVVIPLAAVGPVGMAPLQGTDGDPAEVRGAGVYADTPNALTGTRSDNPPVLAVDFTGDGGYATSLPATNRYFGAACGGQIVGFYQAFLQGERFDLGDGFTLTPDNALLPTEYTVTAGAPPVDLSKRGASPDSTEDDEVVYFPLNLVGTSFAYVGGSCTEFNVCTNGFVYLGGGNPGVFGGPPDHQYTPNVYELLGGDYTTPFARIAPLWTDLDAGANTALDPDAGLYIYSDAVEDAIYVTWYRVGRFGVPGAGNADYTFQCRFDMTTGAIECRYASTPKFCSVASYEQVGAIVGFSPGTLGGQLGADAQSRDLSDELPLTTSAPAFPNHMALRAVGAPDVGGDYYGGRLFPGNAVTWDVYDVPPGAFVGALLLDTVALSPGLHLPGLMAPGCVLSLGGAPVVHELFVLPSANVVGAVPFAIPAGHDPTLVGLPIYAQFALFDLSGLGPLIAGTSNAIEHTIGLR